MSGRRAGRPAGLWDKDVLVRLPAAGLAPREAAFDGAERLRAALRERGAPPAAAVKVVFFVRAASEAELERRRRDAAAALRAVLPGARPSVGVVAQAPEGGRPVALEALVLRRPSRRLTVVPKRQRGLTYVVLEAADGREVLAGGIRGGRTGGPAARTAAAFARAAALLRREGLGFADVVRQWNFVEDITGRTRGGRGMRQNYQIFNDIRAEAYSEQGLGAGFPAATGIGSAAGGFVLELIAAGGAAAARSVAVSNPRQTDAHRYSSRVLVGAAAPGGRRRRTPKFERARVVVEAGGAAVCHVSGTAAIVGEEVAGRGDVAAQTRTTIDNIRRLVTPSNLRRSGLPAAAPAARFGAVRTYVKNEADVPAVSRIVRAAFPGAPALFVVADVCREDLLVEIEGLVDVATG
jgi:enamine deaminase RidA (YjgF/YER057c/UK114 family)